VIRNRYTAAITDKPWWLAGGIAPGACIAAYQAVGAFSIGASLINLVAPGTFDLSNSEIGWDATNGWKRTSNSTVLSVDITALPTSYEKTVLIRTVTPASLANYLLLDGNSKFYIRALPSSRFINGGATYTAYTLSASTAYVICMAGSNIYVDGADVGDNSGANAATTTLKIMGDGTNTYAGTIQAIAFYDTVLTQSQVAALTAAMNAL
jgi:hypothetical protein